MLKNILIIVMLVCSAAIIGGVLEELRDYVRPVRARRPYAFRRDPKAQAAYTAARQERIA